MKKLFISTLTMILTVTCWYCSANEANRVLYQSGDYNYILLEDGTAEITNYSGEVFSLKMPDVLDGYIITSIRNGAFDECENLVSVTIPDSVTRIGDGAFYNCDNLSDVTIGMAVEHVGYNPFNDCDLLTKIVVSPDHPFLATIDQVLFHKLEKRLICYPMGLSGVSYVVPDGIQSIGSGAFSGCERLSSVMIPESVTNIGDGTFYYCANLTKVNIPNGVTSIGFGTFYSCMSLSSVTIPDSVTTIGESAFYFCISLTNLTVPDSIMSIGDFAFEYCDKLTLTVGRNSYAREYALENYIPYTYPDASDWLNN